jgi:hypothetical protein
MADNLVKDNRRSDLVLTYLRDRGISIIDTKILINVLMRSSEIVMPPMSVACGDSTGCNERLVSQKKRVPLRDKTIRPGG